MERGTNQKQKIGKGKGEEERRDEERRSSETILLLSSLMVFLPVVVPSLL